MDADRGLRSDVVTNSARDRRDPQGRFPARCVQRDNRRGHAGPWWWGRGVVVAVLGCVGGVIVVLLLVVVLVLMVLVGGGCNDVLLLLCVLSVITGTGEDM